MRTYFAYIRVSTARQGERGSSLIEQRGAIERYAVKQGLHISDWFEERDTAAKRGRTVFRRMLTRLKKGTAHGLIMHKVDRGARNLADWAELASLMDLGIDIHFAHEALDLTSRGGRLSADIQAVVAADYIRNLRQEVKKGMYGRLKQGILPYGAPPGYQNNGEGGQQKTIDPIQGPLVRETFERYATGDYSYYTLTALMTRRGLRNKAGKPFPVTGICKLLRNTYYYGIITTKGQTFAGAHEPLITKELFDRCKAQREDRVAPRPEPKGVCAQADDEMCRLRSQPHSRASVRPCLLSLSHQNLPFDLYPRDSSFGAASRPHGGNRRLYQICPSDGADVGDPRDQTRCLHCRADEAVDASPRPDCLQTRSPHPVADRRRYRPSDIRCTKVRASK
jgi:DNA invertase Pin-like site-specific DNA recombinase